VVNAIAHIHIETPRLTKQGFVAGGAAAVAVAGGLLLGISLRFHKYAPQQLATFLTLHQQAADQLGGDVLGRAGEEALREMVGGVLGERGGYGSGLRLLDLFYDSSAIPKAIIATLKTNEAVASEVPIKAQILILCFCRIAAIPRPIETILTPTVPKRHKPKITAAAEFSSTPPGAFASQKPAIKISIKVTMMLTMEIKRDAIPILD